MLANRLQLPNTSCEQFQVSHGSPWFRGASCQCLLLRGSIPDSLGRLAFVKLQFFGRWLVDDLVKLRDDRQPFFQKTPEVGLQIYN